MFKKGKLLTNLRTHDERVADHCGGTSAYGVVVDHATLGSEATGSVAGINALLIYASLILLTVRLDGALWATIGWRTEVTRQARANRLFVDLATLAVGSAWAWVAGVFLLNF